MQLNTTSRGREPHLYSIGHSTLSLARFLELLVQYDIQVLVDIRSRPFSRHVPHFNGPELKAAIRRVGIRYLFLGDELGGRPSSAEYYDSEGHVLYGRLSEAPSFIDGIQRLESGASKYR